MSKSTLFDSKICIGCGACSEGCKEVHHLGGDFNPQELGPDTYTIVKDVNGIFVRNFCRHCLTPACASACPVGALQKTEDGPVIYDQSRCIGCRYCFVACPYGIPRYQWASARPLVRKCDFCADLLAQGEPPACAQVCPTGATRFGERDELLREARSRINADPQGYFNHIFGESEAGGSSVLFIADRDISKLGLQIPRLTDSLASFTRPFINSVPAVALGTGAVLLSVWWTFHRRREVLEKEREESGCDSNKGEKDDEPAN